MYLTKAVAAQRQLVRHDAHAIFAAALLELMNGM
jgi:hypothetical protein